MKKRLGIILMVTFVAVIGMGCSQPVEETVATEESVTLEPEEAVTVTESGQTSEESSENKAENTETEGIEAEDKETKDKEVDTAVKEETANLFPAFELKNLEEETRTEALFTEHELTLVNIWGTTCGPCIREMPELEKLQNTYKDQGLKVVGIIADGNYLAGKEITSALLLTYEHIVPDEDFAKDYLSQFQFVPTTVFVDKEGKILGQPMVGAYDYETFEETVKDYLELE